MGPARVHALVRAPRRAGAGAPRQRPHGGARPLSELPLLEIGYPRTELRAQLIAAILAGEKTATAGLAELYEAEGEEIPAPGARRALAGLDDEPVAVVELTEVRVLPAREIDVAFARDEGEGFETVEDWRVAHERFFGRTIEPETPIVAIRFRVVGDA